LSLRESIEKYTEINIELSNININMLKKVWEIIERDFIKPVDNQKIWNYALEGMEKKLKHKIKKYDEPYRYSAEHYWFLVDKASRNSNKTLRINYL